MADYPPPNENPPIFNPTNWQFANSSLTLAEADARYLQLSGGTERGLVFFNAGLDTATISHLGNTFTMPSATGTLAITSQTVNLTGNQTVAGIKTFSSAPDVPSLTNSSNTFTMPASSGQLALVSQIPSSANYVDLTTNQTVAGIKTFSDVVVGKYVASNPWTAPSFSFNGFSGAGMYYATDSVNYENIGFTVNSVYRASIGRNIISGGSFFSCWNTDNTFMGGFNSSSGVGPGFFQVGSSAGSFTCNITYAGGASNNLILPTTAAGTFLITRKSYPTQASEGITLKDAQTINTASNLQSVTINMDSTTITDSATAGSGTVAQVSDILLGQRTFNCTNSSVTYTKATTLQIKGPPVAGTNCTITAGGATAVQVDSGNIAMTTGSINLAATGSSGTPLISFNAGSLGLYSGSSGQFVVDASGSHLMILNGGVAQFIHPIKTINGTAGAPVFTFTNDITSGLFLAAVGNPALSATGVNIMNWTATTTSINLAGSAATPSLTFLTDTGSGFYRPAANQVGITISGSQVGKWSSTGLTVTGATATTTLKVGSGTTQNQVEFGSQTFVAPNIATSGTANATVTFANAFASAPSVFLSMYPAAGSGFFDGCVLSVGAASITTTQFVIQIKNLTLSTTTGDCTVLWYAVQ